MINSDTYQRETLSERPIQQPLNNDSMQGFPTIDTINY